MQSSKKTVRLTRRQFVAVGALGGTAVAIGCKLHENSNWDFLSNDQATTLAAICDQIVPADEFPSASQAGVLTYIDRQLMRHYRPHRDAYRDGLKRANEMSRQRFSKDLARLSAPQQLQVVIAIEKEDSAFFNLVRTHTMEGYYGSPRHGGNRDAASWRMLGLPEPPLRGRAQYDLTRGASS